MVTKHSSRLALIALLALTVTSFTRVNQAKDVPVGTAANVDPSLLQGLRYRMIGPHRGSRVTAVAGITSQEHTFYMGSTGGGVWKTIDAGDVWTNVSDKYFATGAVGAIGVSESDPNVVYVGTGSGCIRNDVEVGKGIYKSTDAGATWKLVGLEDSGQIAQVRVDPRDPNLVYVAALGHAFGANATRGVFRSRDGGQTWDKVLFVNDQTGAADLSMDAHDSHVLYAAMWTGARHPWGLIAGSTDAGIFKTTDGGDHWTKLSGGLPTGKVGRIGVTVSGADSNRAYAVVDAETGGGIFRSDDAGLTWTRVNSSRVFTGRSWYYAHIWADPMDLNMVYTGNQDFYRSIDGGKTFTPIALPHGDNHALWINPIDNHLMIEGNDGGATISIDNGLSWSSQLNQPTAEMYRVAVDDQFPYHVYGAQQDQYDALSVPSRSANFGDRLQLQRWYAVGGEEGGFVAVVPGNSNIVYASGPGGLLTRLDRSEMQIRGINVYPGSQRYRFTWNAPLFILPLEPTFVYHTSQVVHRTTDGGQTWNVISPDLTRDDKSKEALPPGGIGSEAMPYPTISAFSESPLKRGVLWAGSDDGLIHVSLDDGAHWKDVTPKAMPEWATVNSIDPSPFSPGRAYVAVMRYLMDDYRPYIFRTDDYGQNWTLLTDGNNGIPSDKFVRVVREDPVQRGLLYAGGEFGMFVSFDDGAHWQSLQLNLPVTPVTDIVVKDDDLVLSTSGRSFWILDDINPLRHIAVESISAPHLFPARDTYRVSNSAEESDQPYIGGACCVANARDLYYGARIEMTRLGEEPPDGVIADVAFPQTPPDAVTLQVVDSAGKVLRTLLDTTHGDENGPHVVSGLNRFVWDFRVEPEAPGVPKPAPRGPKAVPGSYQFRLTVGGQTQTASFRLLADPRLRDVTQADYQSQFDMLMNIDQAIAQIRRTTAAIRQSGRGNEDLTAIGRQLGGAGAAADGEEGFGGGGLAGQLNNLDNFVANSVARPTGAAVERWNEIKKTLDEQLTKANALIGSGAGTANP